MDPLLEKIILDSKLIQEMIHIDDNSENKEQNELIDPAIFLQGINIDLLKSFYNDEVLTNKNLLELAEIMNKLDSFRLIEVLMEIENRFLDYSSLNINLRKAIHDLQKITEVACGEDYSIGKRCDGTICFWGNYNSHEMSHFPNGINDKF